MCTENLKLRFTKVRKVKTPIRAHSTDAGIDFFFPEDIPYPELVRLNSNINLSIVPVPHLPANPYSNMVFVKVSDNDIVESISLPPHTRLLIPSGIKVLLTPKESMLRADNKSGVAIRTGIIIGADVVDSAYTGEMGIHIINTSNVNVKFKAGDKLIQFIHTPVYLSELEEIDKTTYDNEALNWGSRGSNGFGSEHTEPVGEVINSNGETSD